MTETARVAGRYQLGDLVGHGGMADVRRGEDTLLQRPVAIKLLHDDLARDPDFRGRFRQEAQAAAKVEHPAIVRIWDAGEESERDADGQELIRPYIVMEYVAGQSLGDRVALGPMPETEAVKIADRVLEALGVAHAAGVVHRDIKPANIMLTHAGDVKVLDFGIARAVSETSGNVAETTRILGTARYFSPEQAKGEDIGPASDLYSLGVVLYEMLTGQPPFVGESPVAVAYQHVREEPVAPAVARPGLSEQLSAVVMTALQKDPADRFRDAQAFRDALAAAASGRDPGLDRTADTTSTGEFTALLTGGGVEQQVHSLAAPQLDIPLTQKGPPVGWVWAGILGVGVVIVAIIFWLLHLQAPQISADSVPVPDLVGVEQATAVEQLEAAQLVVVVTNRTDADVPAGTVIETVPAGGATVAPGTSVSLIVSSGTEQRRVPSVSGMTPGKAREAIEAAGFVVGAVEEVESGSVQKNRAIDTEPTSGTIAGVGTEVRILISNGRVRLPDLIGDDLADATAELTRLGIRYTAEADRDCSERDGDPIRSQSPDAGRVSQDTEVTIRYCIG